ncbi:MAG: hypothetical protein V1908_04515 [Candidatus Peregrinibacteria bacterium]
MLDSELQYYIGKILCTADPKDPSRFLHRDLHRIFLVFGFTGSGKDTVINEFLKVNKEYPFAKFIRTLTRTKRPSELEMVDGFFIQQKLFDHLKDHGRFFYSYERYDYLKFGYDTLSLLFQLTRNNVVMVGGTEKNYDGLMDGIHSIFGSIPVTTIFVNRPKEDILAHIKKRGGDPEEMEARLKFIEKEWYEKPQKPMDYVIWNNNLTDSVHQFQGIVQEILGSSSGGKVSDADSAFALLSGSSATTEQRL